MSDRPGATEATPSGGLPVLGIDAATPPASLAVVAPDREPRAITGPFGRHTDAWIMDALGGLLEDAGLGLDDLGAIGVTIGPGTFTGIRVGLATALGLARALRVPAIGVLTLEAIAADVEPGGDLPVLATVDARRGQVYAGLLRHEGATVSTLREPWLATPAELAEQAEQIGPLRAAGTGLDVDEVLSGLPRATPSGHPLAVAVARLAAARGASAGAPTPAPFYLRGPDATVGRNPLERAATGRPRAPRRRSR